MLEEYSEMKGSLVSCCHWFPMIKGRYLYNLTSHIKAFTGQQEQSLASDYSEALKHMLSFDKSPDSWWNSDMETAMLPLCTPFGWTSVLGEALGSWTTKFPLLLLTSMMMAYDASQHLLTYTLSTVSNTPAMLARVIFPLRVWDGFYR